MDHCIWFEPAINQTVNQYFPIRLLFRGLFKPVCPDPGRSCQHKNGIIRTCRLLTRLLCQQYCGLHLSTYLHNFERLFELEPIIVILKLFNILSYRSYTTSWFVLSNSNLFYRLCFVITRYMLHRNVCDIFYWYLQLSLIGFTLTLPNALIMSLRKQQTFICHNDLFLCLG